MTIGRSNWTLLAVVLSATLLWGQSDTSQPQEDANRSTPPAAFGQDNPPMVVNDNPPISGLDQPSLEPNIQPRSMLLGGVEASESLDSNFGSDARTAWRSVTRGLAGLTLQRLWNRYQFAGAYVGGASYYNGSGIGLQQIHELQAQQAFLWRTGQLTVRDSLSYLPEGAFGYGAYGGSGGFQLGLGGLGEGLGMLGSGFGGHFGVLGSNQLGSLGQGPRLTNVSIVDVVQGLTPRSSVTAAGSFGFVHFDHALQAFGGSQGLINSQEVAGQMGYSYSVTRKDQVGISYGYQSFHFPASLIGTDNLGSHVVQGMYGHRISGRMDFVIGAGPQWTHLRDPLAGSSSRVTASGRATLRYRFRVTMAALSFERYDTSGSGFFAGAQSNIAEASFSRPFGRHYQAQASLGYSHNQRLQSSLAGAASTTYNYGFAGLTVRRQFGYNWGAFLGYQWNDQIFDTCPVVGTFCNRISVRHVGTIGVDWHFRPIRID
jgi:hypothetical protein